MKNEILSMWKLKPTLEYTTGWKVFGELLQFGLILGSIMIICVISGIFAEESQTKMLPLIFTTVEGKMEGYFSQSSGFFYDNSSVICRNYRKCMGIMQNSCMT